MQKAVPLLLALVAVPAAGVSLRQRGDPAKPKDIKEKWNKMDDFLEVMFTMACKWKNGKDVYGQAKAALKDGEVDGADGYAAYAKDLQAKNVKGLERSCGFIVGDGKKECRSDCAARWNAIAGKRDECDEACEKVYANLERSCKSKADNLAKVYAQKAQKAAGQKQCYEGHCKEFPMVWMKADEKAMTAEVEDQCKKRCTDENVKIGCQQKWALEVDFQTAEVASECAEASGMSKCMAKKKDAASSDYDACKKDTKASCDKDYDACTKKGNADKNFKDAKAFCDDRKKMCLGQADKKCLDGNKAALDKGESDCKEEAGKEKDDCMDKELTKREGEAEKKCIAKKGPACAGDCKGKCEVGKMNKCLLKLNSKDDPGKLFCTDFWHLLHTSAEVDPVTGNPIALLSPKATVKLAI